MDETIELKTRIKKLGIDLVGITSLNPYKKITMGIHTDRTEFFNRYHNAVVLGCHLGDKSANEMNLFMEQAALDAMTWLEDKGHNVLIIHPEDEFDPVKRLGLISLKALAKGAGLGWQGRSLLIISPEIGPIYRCIGLLTDMDLSPDASMPNLCGDCSLCIDKCPQHALKLVRFDDHPSRREDVLDVRACRGDKGCNVCLAVCPWIKHLN
jgi:epoxyqueuosine reductase QueG